MSIKKPVQEVIGKPKMRRCLSCRKSFRSDWAGERICPKCKSSSAWRSGTAPQQSPGKS